MELDDEVASFLQPGPLSVVVCTRDAEKRPDVVRGWGPRVLDDRATIEVFVGRGPAWKLVENVRDNGAMALAVSLVTTYQTVQLKGKCVEVGEPEECDFEHIRSHVDGFVAGIDDIGMSGPAARGAAVTDVIKLRFRPESIFDQTPGPEAGKPR